MMTSRSGHRSRISRVSPMPSVPGILRSTTASENSRSPSRRSASGALDAEDTPYCWEVYSSSSWRQMKGSSSTMRIRVSITARPRSCGPRTDVHAALLARCVRLLDQLATVQGHDLLRHGPLHAGLRRLEQRLRLARMAQPEPYLEPGTPAADSFRDADAEHARR